MGTRNIIPDVGFKLGNTAATRPRTVLFVLMFLVFVALQGSAAAEMVNFGGELVGTNGEAGVDTGP
jgi:hypothetical protein